MCDPASTHIFSIYHNNIMSMWAHKSLWMVIDEFEHQWYTIRWSLKERGKVNNKFDLANCVKDTNQQVIPNWSRVYSGCILATYTLALCLHGYNILAYSYVVACTTHYYRGNQSHHEVINKHGISAGNNLFANSVSIPILCSSWYQWMSTSLSATHRMCLVLTNTQFMPGHSLRANYYHYQLICEVI